MRRCTQACAMQQSCGRGERMLEGWCSSSQERLAWTSGSVATRTAITALRDVTAATTSSAASANATSVTRVDTLGDVERAAKMFMIISDGAARAANCTRETTGRGPLLAGRSWLIGDMECISRAGNRWNQPLCSASDDWQLLQYQ